MMTKSSSIKRTMPIDFDKIVDTKRIKVDYVDNNEKIDGDDTELMTSEKGKVHQLDKNSSKTKDEKESPSKKDSSGRKGKASSAVVEEMMIFLTGKSCNERSRYAKAIKFPSKVSKKPRARVLAPRAGDNKPTVY